MPKTDAERDGGLEVINGRLEANWQQLEVSKMLEGLTLLSRQKTIGTCCVSGPLEKVEALKAFLEEKKIGSVMIEDVRFRAVQ